MIPRPNQPCAPFIREKTKNTKYTIVSHHLIENRQFKNCNKNIYIELLTADSERLQTSMPKAGLEPPDYSTK